MDDPNLLRTQEVKSALFDASHSLMALRTGARHSTSEFHLAELGSRSKTELRPINLSSKASDVSADSFYEPENFKIPPQHPKRPKRKKLPGLFYKKNSQENAASKKVTFNQSINDSIQMQSYDECSQQSPESVNVGHNKARARTRYSVFIAGIENFDPYLELTAMQIAAFREVFDMVDKDGGGGIDAQELYNSMKDLESNLNYEEIREILEELDRDGNGEINFEEFLYMMTSMSLQIKEAEREEHRKHNVFSRNFFNVITKFAMKHSLKEIERYYASKARYSPHVVGHYAAGARVEGLTEKELRKTWKEFSIANKGKDSPYAQPLNFVISSHHGERYKKKTIRVNNQQDRAGSGKTVSFVTIDGKETPVTSIKEKKSKLKGSKSPRSTATSGYRARGSSSISSREIVKGWTPRHRLPMANSELPVVSYNSKRRLTIEDMQHIRDTVNSARHRYYNGLLIEKDENALEYWDALKIDEIESKRLQSNFKKSFRAYSPTNEYEHGCRKYEVGEYRKNSDDKDRPWEMEPAFSSRDKLTTPEDNQQTARKPDIIRVRRHENQRNRPQPVRTSSTIHTHVPAYNPAVVPQTLITASC